MSRRTTEAADWTYQSAAATIPYVQRCLKVVRECYVEFRHLLRLAGWDADHPRYHGRLASVKADGLAAVNEIGELGICIHESPIRGVALYKFVVYCHDGVAATTRQAYYVFKDSRVRIDSYVFADELRRFHDLLGWERAVPAAWMARTDAKPTVKTTRSRP